MSTDDTDYTDFTDKKDLKKRLSTDDTDKKDLKKRLSTDHKNYFKMIFIFVICVICGQKLFFFFICNKSVLLRGAFFEGRVLGNHVKNKK